MRFSIATTLVVALAAETAVASTWFSKPIYNKWHETELERWLSDHDVPYPTPADRKDLENLVKSNWNAAIETPYSAWDNARLRKYLEVNGHQVEKSAAKNKDSLVKSVKGTWLDAEGAATKAYGSVKDWIFDTWTDSSLKAFADKHGIPVPQPRTRDSLLKVIRENYHAAAVKAGETAAYPGNWLYTSWSDSDLKAWLDEHGVPVPQPSSRDKLVATVRRNSYVASQQAKAYLASASKSAAAAQSTLSEAVFDAWSDSEIKAWADKNGIKVPQGSKRNELLAIARKNVAKLTGDNVSGSAASGYNAASASASSAASAASASASSAASLASKSAASAYGAATSSAGNEYAQAYKDASQKGNQLYYQASSVIVSVISELQVAVGLKTNYASSASRSYSSLSSKASASAKSLKNEL